MSRIKKVGIVEPVLTELSRGYKNDAFVADSLFPIVQSGKEYGKIPQFGKEAFKIYPTERAIRAKSNIISPDDKDTIDFVMTEHDLAYPVDYREDEEDMFDAKQEASDIVSEAIDLRREYLTATLAQNDANYASGNKVTLSGTSQFTHASSDPIGVFQTAKEALKAKIASGAYMLTAMIGEKSFYALKNHAQLIEKIKYSMKGIPSTDLMKEIFELDNIVIGRGVYLDESTGNFVNLWGDNIILAYVPKKASSYRVPSFGYTIRRKGMPFVDSYWGEGNKVQFIRKTDIFTVKQCSNVAGYIIKDTNA